MYENGCLKRKIGYYIDPNKEEKYRKDNGWLGVRIKNKLDSVDERLIKGLSSNEERISKLEGKYYRGNAAAAAKQIAIVATFKPDLSLSID